MGFSGASLRSVVATAGLVAYLLRGSGLPGLVGAMRPFGLVYGAMRLLYFPVYEDGFIMLVEDGFGRRIWRDEEMWCGHRLASFSPRCRREMFRRFLGAVRRALRPYYSPWAWSPQVLRGVELLELRVGRRLDRFRRFVDSVLNSRRCGLHGFSPRAVVSALVLRWCYENYYPCTAISAMRLVMYADARRVRHAYSTAWGREAWRDMLMKAYFDAEKALLLCEEGGDP